MAAKTKTKIVTELTPKYSEMSFTSPASRIELFVRIIWIIVAGLVLIAYNIVYSIIIIVFYVIAMILNIVNWFYILIFGKRWEAAFNWSAETIYNRYVRYMIYIFNYMLRQAPYQLLMTDSRPELLKFTEVDEKYFKGLKKK
jgi:cellulose synthase/poly-beta-1,6-N-acetylglucosamine synthase-like glycosyltransferase